MALFKYLPGRYIDQFVEHGDVRFCSLASYQDIEDGQVRGDQLEGSRRFAPQGGLDITRNQAPVGKTPGTSYVSEVSNPAAISVFCMSTVLSEELANRFESDACIEVIDVNLFTRRLRTQINKVNKRLIYGDINYYDETVGPGNVHELPDLLVLAKRSFFQWQHEYRFVFGSRIAFEFGQTKHSLVIGDGSPKEPNYQYPRPKRIKVGNLREVCRIHSFG